MASFLDKTPSFNPYIQQLPVEAMVAVGTQKQKAYEQGVQRIQTEVDNIAGLDVARDVDKAYLQSKLNALGNNLRTVAAGDFSNFQFVNSVSGMTKQLIRDEGIQTAVSSTAKLRKEQSFMEEERKKGTLDPSNELHFNKKVNKWYNGSDVNESLTAKYVPFFDVQKFAKETFDAVMPDSYSYDQVYELGKDGKPLTDSRGIPIYSKTMQRLEKEGRFPEKVKATLNQIFSDPRVNQQLAISGEYTYRNHDGQALSGIVNKQRESITAAYTDKLYNLYLEKSLGKSNDTEIEATKRALENTTTSYDEATKLSYSNPDAVRAMLYKDDVNSRYTTMFGYVKEKRLEMDNPGFKMEFELQKERNEQSRFAQTLAQNKLEHRDDLAYKYDALAQQKELTLKAIEAKAAGKKPGALGGGTGPAGQTPTKSNQPSIVSAQAVQETNFETAKDNFAVANDQFLWQTAFKDVGNNNQKLQKLVDMGMPEAEAISKILDKSAAALQVTPDRFRAEWSNRAKNKYKAMSAEDKARNSNIVGAYAIYSDADRVFQNELVVKKKIDADLKLRLGETADKINLADIKPQKISFLDVEYNMDKQDMMDLAIIKKVHFDNFASGAETKASQEAERRITSKGKGPLIEAIINDNFISAKSIGQVVPFAKGLLKDLGGLKEVYRTFAYDSENKKRDWSGVDKIAKLLDSEVYAKAMVEKEKIINEAYGIKPNMSVGLTTGKNEIDSQTLANIKRFAGGYKADNVGNLSSDFSEFASKLSDSMKENRLSANAIIGPNNEPMVEIVNYDANSKRIGGMVIAPDEAATLDIDVNSLYENREISSLRSRMKYNGNQTSNGNPKDKDTYENGDSYYDEQDFALLQGTDIEAQANFIFANNSYYPVVYVKKGNESNVRQMPGLPSLQQASESVLKLDTTLANKILKDKPNPTR